MEQAIITFPSVYHAFRGRKLLTQQGIAMELIPIPRELSAACEGLAAIMDQVFVAEAVALLESKNVLMLQKGIKYPLK
jgi:hypothetical protein